jgi:hypothetical protein
MPEVGSVAFGPGLASRERLLPRPRRDRCRCRSSGGRFASVSGSDGGSTTSSAEGAEAGFSSSGFGRDPFFVRVHFPRSGGGLASGSAFGWELQRIYSAVLHEVDDVGVARLPEHAVEASWLENGIFRIVRQLGHPLAGGLAARRVVPDGL